MIYLGSLGRMVGVACPAEQQVTPADRYTFQTTLEGRVKAQFRPGGRRAWDLRLPRTSSPLEVSKLTDFTSGAWGPGPFRFVSAEAPITNLLPPGVAACESRENPSVVIGDGGPMRLSDGSWSARSYLSSNPNLVMFFGVADGPGFGSGHAVPVVPGGMVTGAVTVLGEGAYAQLRFYDFADDLVSSSESSVRASAGASVRSVVTAQVPAGAVSVRVLGRNAVQGSRPQVTWTKDFMPWADGRGCARSVVLGGQSELVRTNQGPNNRTLEGVSFTVQEVG